MPSILTESNIEDVALEILSELGYNILHGLDIAQDGINPQRKSYSDFVLVRSN
jgi:type I restriction enzyme R subunit